jgi:hypothetical protein
LLSLRVLDKKQRQQPANPITCLVKEKLAQLVMVAYMCLFCAEQQPSFVSRNLDLVDLVDLVVVVSGGGGRGNAAQRNATAATSPWA